MDNPIKSLYENMFETFSLGTIVANQRLNETLEKELLHPGIIINVHPSPFKGPNVDFSIKRIVLHESFLSYLWCLTYSFISMYQSQKSTENPNINNFDGTSKDVIDTENLLHWSLSLQQEHSFWPINLPSPIKDDEKSILVNNIFIHVSNFTMYHEIAHAACDHSNYLTTRQKVIDLIDDNKIPPINLTSQLKQIETEADNYALECLISKNDNDSSIFHKSLGAIISVLSNLYYSNKNLTHYTHPDDDVRVFNILQNSNFEDEGYKFKIETTINMGLTLYLHMKKIDYLPKSNTNFDSTSDILRYLFDIIDNSKAETK
jgi:hypothetical protein